MIYMTLSKRVKYIFVYVYMLPRVTLFFSQLHKKITGVPTIIAGRWKMEDSHIAMRKSDWSTEDHCGCDEMRIKYLHEKEQLEDLIEQYKKDLDSKK